MNIGKWQFALLRTKWYYIRAPLEERVSHRRLQKSFPRKVLTWSTQSDIIVKSLITASKNLEN